MFRKVAAVAAVSRAPRSRAWAGVFTVVAFGALASSVGAQDTVGVVIDAKTGLVQMVVVPDDDKELADPAFNPPGSTQVRLPLAEFRGGTSEQFVARAGAAARQKLKAQMAPLPAPAGRRMSAAEAAEFQRVLKSLTQVPKVQP